MADLRRTHPEVDVVVHRGGHGRTTRWSWGWNDRRTQVDLDTPLVGPIGRAGGRARCRPSWTSHTVGDLVRHYPRRYVDRGRAHRHRRPGARRARHGASRRSRRSTHARHAPRGAASSCSVVIRDGSGGGSTAPSSTRYKLKARDEARAAGAVLRQGRRVQRASCSSPTRSSSRSTRATSVRPFLSDLPGHAAKIGSWQIAPLRAAGARRCSTTRPTRCRRRCARRESLAELGRALRRIHVPETEADHPRRPQPAGVGRGDGRAARARAAPRRPRVVPPGRGLPAACRAACSTRSTPGCRSR